MAAKNWRLRRRENDAFVNGHPEIDPLLAKILWARHIDQPEQLASFLREPGLLLADPLLMLGMDRATDRLARAIESHEQMVVYGDFDADGVSSTALLLSALRALGAVVDTYIPDRFSESYGLNTPALERLYSMGARLVVTVDCGIRSVAEVEAANRLGLDIVITDHHAIPPVLPPAYAVVDPKQSGCPYPFKELSGVGIAYQLSRALYHKLCQREPERELLDLVALGTVSDIVPLTGENRILVQHGLDVLHRTQRPGLQALMCTAGIVPEQADSTAIAFRLGPRINAAGRLHSAQLALDLLTTNEPDKAESLAQQLSAINGERQSLLNEQVELAQELLSKTNHERLLFAAHPDFHEGLVGLVASRLCEEYYRPAFVMKCGDENTRGSARSIEGLHVTAALDTCQDLLLRYGGHAKAAGFTLATRDIDNLRERLEQHIASLIQADTFTQRLLVDAIVPLEMISPHSPVALQSLEPIGDANPEPALATLALKVAHVRQIGADNRHLRLDVSDGNRALPVIAFRQGDKAAALANGQLIDMVYRPSIEAWQGQETLQLIAQDIRIH
ncbi:MAG: single-stranded-DNA-specific exonuclease RecJ [Chloroflexi bacterium]|nr:single-stranded-DNA-specific exonuclease RecJ [Chloroflexota bacterium]